MYSSIHRLTGRTIMIGMVILFLIVSCSPTTSLSVTQTPTDSKSPLPTWTSTVTLTPTINKTLKPTPTPRPTSTITKTPLPTLPPLPTIPLDNLRLFFEILFATNGGCRLPCFWGITPGITTTAELKQFVSQFPEDLVDVHIDYYAIHYITSKSEDAVFTVVINFENDLVQSIILGEDAARYYVTLPKLLNEYGTPTQILVRRTIGDNTLFMLVLYENQQFMGEYELFPNQHDNSLYCYDPQFSPDNVITWSPIQSWSDFIGYNQEQSYKPLDEVSDYDIPSLHNILKNPNRALCMKFQVDQIPP